MARNIWTEEESEIVAFKAAQLINDDPSIGKVAALKKAQLELNFDRRKTDSGLNGAAYGAGKFKKFFDDKIKEVKNRPIGWNHSSPINPDPVAEPTKVPVDDLRLAPVDEEIKDTMQSLLDIDLVIGPLVSAFRMKLRAALSGVIAEELAKSTDDAIEHIHSTIAEVQKLPKIVVVGMKGGTMTRIREEFKGMANLSFIDADDSAHRAQSAAKYATAVVILKDFVSHSLSNSMKKASNNVHEIKGGVTAVTNIILEIIAS